MGTDKKQIMVPDISRQKPVKNRKDYVVHKNKKKAPKYAIMSDTLCGTFLWCVVTAFLLHINPNIDTRFSVLFMPVIAMPWYFRKNY